MVDTRPLDDHHAALLAWYKAEGNPPFRCVADILDTIEKPPAAPEPEPVPLDIIEAADIDVPETPMTITELARYLRLTPSILYRHVNLHVLALDCDKPISPIRIARAASPDAIAEYLQSDVARQSIRHSRKSETQRRANRGAHP